MMSSAVWSVFYLIALTRRILSVIWHCPVGSSRTVVASCELSTGLALHCSRMYARPIGHNGSGARRLVNTRA
jgi:hypothetical protein